MFKTLTLTRTADTLSRPAAIGLLRDRLSSLCREGECACTATARLDVFCGGLRDLTDAQLRARFAWIVRTRPKMPREELERLIGLYHLGRQEVDGLPICCDVETREHCACDGWNRFDNLALEGAILELTGRMVVVE